MPDVLLIGRDWTARALLRAQLLEEGVEVKAFETAADALEGLVHSATLIVADISANDQPSVELDQLALWAKRIPTWLLASHSANAECAIQGRGFERVLFRPVMVGELVRDIKERLNQARANSE